MYDSDLLQTIRQIRKKEVAITSFCNESSVNFGIRRAGLLFRICLLPSESLPKIELNLNYRISRLTKYPSAVFFKIECHFVRNSYGKSLSFGAPVTVVLNVQIPTKKVNQQILISYRLARSTIVRARALCPLCPKYFRLHALNSQGLLSPIIASQQP